MKTGEDFRAAMHAAGLAFDGTIIDDEKVHRFKANGDRRRNSCFGLGRRLRDEPSAKF